LVEAMLHFDLQTRVVEAVPNLGIRLRLLKAQESLSITRS